MSEKSVDRNEILGAINDELVALYHELSDARETACNAGCSEEYYQGHIEASKVILERLNDIREELGYTPLGTTRKEIVIDPDKTVIVL